MADNRIELVCRCGERICIGKRLGDPDWYTPPCFDGVMHRVLTSWYEEHSLCGDTMDPFDLEYECEPDWRNRGSGGSLPASPTMLEK